MLGELFIKEFKYIFKNITFYIFIGVVLLFYFTQFSPPKSIDGLKPLPPEELKAQGKAEYYGYKPVEDEEQEMVQMYGLLYLTYNNDDMLVSGIMINKNVKLSQEQKNLIKEVMDKLAPEGFKDKISDVKIQVDYSKYLELIDKLDKDLGGNTPFSKKNRKMYLSVPKTYEEALEDYKEIIEKDKLTNAAAREFSDYMGITAGFFVIFLSAFILSKDKRSRMQELICSRKITSYKYVIAKYLALIAAITLVYLTIATHATILFAKIGTANNINVDMLAFYKYTLWWIVPTVMFTTAVGMLISTIFNNGLVAVPIQFLLWMNSMLPLIGDYSLTKFVIRFNKFGMYREYVSNIRQISINRGFYVLLSMLVIFAAAYIWSLKRGAVGEKIK